MAISINPFTGQLDLTGNPGMSIGGAITGSTPNALLLVSPTSTLAEIGPLTNGQLVIGSTGTAPVATTLTGTVNQVNITNEYSFNPSNSYTPNTQNYYNITVINKYYVNSSDLA